MITDDEIQSHFMFNVMMSDTKDPELRRLCKEMDSVENLNNNPMAIRKAGYEAMRRAFVLGTRFGQNTNDQEKEKTVG